MSLLWHHVLKLQFGPCSARMLLCAQSESETQRKQNWQVVDNRPCVCYVTATTFESRAFTEDAQHSSTNRITCQPGTQHVLRGLSHRLRFLPPDKYEHRHTRQVRTVVHMFGKGSLCVGGFARDVYAMAKHVSRTQIGNATCTLRRLCLLHGRRA